MVDEVTNKKLNREFLRFSARAETVDPNTLAESFVSIGTLTDVLVTPNHHIVFGRRGTGKTHVLNYVGQQAASEGSISIFIDLRNIGSSIGIYSDPRYSLSDRGSRLLIDVVHAIHDDLLRALIETIEDKQFNQLERITDSISASCAQVQITESMAVTESREGSRKIDKRLGWTDSGPQASLLKSDHQSDSQVIQADGVTQYRVSFGGLSQAFSEIVQLISPRRLFIFLDEWSAIPAELQPYLADLMRRALLSHRGVIVKIGAIEQRSHFWIPGDKGSYVGLEVGADIGANIDLDDFMVFENDSEAAVEFFAQLIARHVITVSQDEAIKAMAANPRRLISKAFTQWNTFEEFVLAAEGVPRDAMHILSYAAQRSGEGPISKPIIRTAAHDWYQRGKENSIRENEEAISLLHWILDAVIDHRKARAFLLRTNIRDKLIDELVDARVIHLLKKSISSRDEPGVRYDAYKIDYGAYVDLLNTTRAPGDLFADGAQVLEVPQVDYRAIRRAILDLDKFREANAQSA